MRYEIKYWKFDSELFPARYKVGEIMCKNKNEVIEELASLCLDGRIEDIEIKDLKKGKGF
jgi:hypothetical protein